MNFDQFLRKDASLAFCGTAGDASQRVFPWIGFAPQLLLVGGGFPQPFRKHDRRTVALVRHGFGE